MPELRWKYGYFVVLGVMALVSGALIVWFKRKKWL
jgi:magnesium transporter